jgi:isoquinoline 1-oxidoreductase beta subunit
MIPQNHPAAALWGHRDATLNSDGGQRPPLQEDLSRRQFFRLSALAGGGLVIGYMLPGSAFAQAPGLDNTARAFTPNAFIKITPDGIVILVAKNPDAGQGVKTALPMILAEELGADFKKVTIEYGGLDPQLGAQFAGGSLSVPMNYQTLRRAGAVARTVLVQAAADTWGVPVAECDAENSTVIHRPTGRVLGFGELATKAASMPLPDEKSVVLKRPKENKLIGNRVGGVDNPAIVTGQPLFGIDQRVPGMVHAVYVKCPVFGGKPVSANLDRIKKVPGVLDAFLVEGTDDYYGLLPGVAIVGDSTWATFKARGLLDVTWDEGSGATQSSAGYEEAAAKFAAGAGKQMRADGDVAAKFASAAKVVEAAYHYPYLHHATLEPMNALAIPTVDGGLDVLAPTQTPDDAQGVAAKAAGLPKEKVKLRFTRIGGGFGRRLTNDFVAEAAVIAKRIGKPVKLTWTREDDTRHGQYRPPAWHFLKGTVDAAGKLSAWSNHFVTVGLNTDTEPARAAELSNNELPARFLANYRLERSIISTNVPTSWLRAPGSNGLAFVFQSFIDELAHAAGRDPLEFRLELLGDDRVLPGNGQWEPPYDTARMKGVLRLAAEKAGWGRKMPRGSGQGIAFHFSHSGYVAEVADVTVSQDGALTVDKVVVAVDVGPIINPSGAENQIQGSIIDGLSGAWLQELTIENGAVVQGNFHDYPLLRINASPKIEIHFIESDNPPTGLGEPAMPPLPPAVCNAIFAATGKRVRRLPLVRNDLAWS